MLRYDAGMTDLPYPYREALALIDRHGDQAAIHVAMEVDVMLKAGDMDGAAHWHLIVAAINKMQDATPAGTMH